ncbi:SSI family serine proteinase inhibitor [Streptomyces sp. NPDC000594]|uniref:SSI family serine proteinase inhibitor n=1 Tax=Streptomyces sp. NPDC000594 TaxID=3154261 RepID=UPI00331925A6
MTVSAALLAAVVPGTAGAAAPPPAGWPPPVVTVPLPIAPVPIGEQDRLTVVVDGTGDPRSDGRYELACEPVGGTHPEREAACARLAELAREGQDPFAPVPEGRMCTQQAGGPATARVTGNWRGRPVDAVFSRTDGCEISRWQILEPVLPSTRSQGA